MLAMNISDPPTYLTVTSHVFKAGRFGTMSRSKKLFMSFFNPFLLKKIKKTFTEKYTIP
jgi:hypothetical protein